MVKELEKKSVEEKIKDKEEKDRTLIDAFIYHMWCLGLKYILDEKYKKEGVKRGEGVNVWIEELGIGIKLLLNHKRSTQISLSDRFIIDKSQLCVVISPSEKNNLGYISRGVENDKFSNVVDESGGKGWKRKINVWEMAYFSLNRLVVEV